MTSKYIQGSALFFRILCGNMFLQMLQPQKPKGATNDNTSPPFPTGNIGFLNGISPIGAKFNPANLYGPQSQKNMMLNYTPIKGKILFDFKNKAIEN